MDKVKVLLVDDEKEYIEAQTERLRARGFEVDVATSGEQALEKQRGYSLENEAKILLVDDEVEYVETLAERMRTRGIEVEIATSGEQAVQKAKDFRFQVVVLDYSMPGMDGMETLKALRENDPDLHFILLTGHATIKVAINAARFGAVDVLEKPIDIMTIIEKIQSVPSMHGSP